MDKSNKSKSTSEGTVSLSWHENNAAVDYFFHEQKGKYMMKRLHPPAPVFVTTIQEALSGRAHTTMLATVSPSSNSYTETMNTLKYAERLKRASAHLSKDSGGQRITKVRYRMGDL